MASGPGVATGSVVVSAVTGGVAAAAGAGLQFSAVGVWAETTFPSESRGLNSNAKRNATSAKNRARLFGRNKVLPPVDGTFRGIPHVRLQTAAGCQTRKRSLPTWTNIVAF